MKKFLCAVDFSRGSVHALDYAIWMAKPFGADVELIWVDNSAESSGLAAISRDLRLEVKKQFDELIAASHQQHPEINLSYKLKRGKVYQEIAGYARSEGIDLIIAGSHGVSGFEQYWIGSNAYRIVSYAPVPTITIRTSYDISRPLRRIVLPIDSTPETLLKIEVAAMFARTFRAEVHVVALFSTTLRSLGKKVESNAEAACRMLKKEGLATFCESRSGENITHSTITFAEEVDADMIAIMTEKGTAQSSILLGHYAQQLINNAPVPVLSINAGIKSSKHES